MRQTRVKICCIGSAKEALLAVRHGASALGLVSSMPSGPGVIDDQSITEIAAQVPPGVATFLLTSCQSAEGIIEQQRSLRTNTIQICDSLLEGTYSQIKQALPGISIVQVIHVTDDSSIEEAESVATHVDAILLDSGNQSLAVKELGGTGRQHDWAISAKIREIVKVPVYLAGGLRPDNVAEAITRVKPFGVDLCSGVRTQDQLDASKLSDFMQAVRQAYAG